ncbi:universal stress protein [Prosthecobacter sp.]|uniref:universal stress protein n=1 Tax=Prosthecobacter sp. TaxID=1965333 RepID=UPI002AB9F691|nr:universal stress protein [Prosthecobacter sp.]MDZ4401501.1 universal stress protein [Prosthecobacter sp.]
MKTIVALVDFTDASSKVLKQTHALASALGSQVVLMHVVLREMPVATYGGEVPPIPIEPSPETILADQRQLDGLVESLTKLGVDARALQFKGPVAETVLAETPRLNADLVIMGSHHHSALYNLFIGSVTADVLKRAPFPVLVVPCDAPAQEKA